MTLERKALQDVHTWMVAQKCTLPFQRPVGTSLHQAAEVNIRICTVSFLFLLLHFLLQRLSFILSNPGIKMSMLTSCSVCQSEGQPRKAYFSIVVIQRLNQQMEKVKQEKSKDKNITSLWVYEQTIPLFIMMYISKIAVDHTSTLKSTLPHPPSLMYRRAQDTGLRKNH